MPDQAQCRSCGDPILWVKTVNGYRMPLDAEPAENGNIVLLDGVAHVRKDQTGPRYLSHFATCIHAASHRKAK